MKRLVYVCVFYHLLITSLFGADLYHLTFDPPTHSVGSPIATGFSLVPNPAPSSRIFGTSIVVPTFAGIDNPAMQFIPTNVSGSGFSYSQYAFDLTPFNQFSKYRVDFDLILSNFQTDGGPFDTSNAEDYFAMYFDVPSAVRLDFTDLGFIHQQTGNIGSFQFGQAMHIVTEVDLAQNRWSIGKDGVELFQGQFFYPYPAAPNLPTTIGSIRLNLADSASFSGSPVAIIDNFRIQVPEPSASLLTLLGMAFLFSHSRDFRKHPGRGF